jgi:coproporphyrinogen III oxidase
MKILVPDFLRKKQKLCEEVGVAEPGFVEQEWHEGADGEVDYEAEEAEVLVVEKAGVVTGVHGQQKEPAFRGEAGRHPVG